MKKLIFPLAAALLITGHLSFGQDDGALQKKAEAAQEKARVAQEKATSAQDRAEAAQDQDRDIRKNLNSDYGEIVIKRKNSGKDEKLIVEIKDDDVFVNGKPIDDFVNDEISVTIRNPKHYTLIAPSSPFRFPGSAWSLENGDRHNGGENITRPFLGVMTEGVSEGTRIISVTDNSAAEKAGLKKDDIITKINDKSVSDHQQLTDIISALNPEDKITITYKRNGRESKTTAVLGKRTMAKSYRRQFINPDDPEAPVAPVPPLPPMEFNFDDLGDRFGRSFGFDNKPRIGIKAQDTEDGKGVKVLSVDDGSAAEKSGIKEEDVITSFDGKTVNSAAELADASRASKDKSSVKIQLKRKGKTQDIELKVPKKLKTATL